MGKTMETRMAKVKNKECISQLICLQYIQHNFKEALFPHMSEKVLIGHSPTVMTQWSALCALNALCQYSCTVLLTTVLRHSINMQYKFSRGMSLYKLFGYQ